MTTLGELIEILEVLPQDRVCEHAFCNPHSYRGTYIDLAFEPTTNRTVAEMLADAKSAVGATYEGYKGGDFTMHLHTEVHISMYGYSDDYLSDYGLQWMLGTTGNRSKLEETDMNIAVSKSLNIVDEYGSVKIIVNDTEIEFVATGLYNGEDNVVRVTRKIEDLQAFKDAVAQL